jgi:hypothetical protein
VEPRAVVDYVEKRKFLILPGLELQLVGCPAAAYIYTDCGIPASYTYIYIYVCISSVSYIKRTLIYKTGALRL